MGNSLIRLYLVQSAQAAVKKKNSHYKLIYNKFRFQLGSHNKAKVAIANRISRMVYNVIKNPIFHFIELGEAKKVNMEKEKNKALNKLKALGFEVSLKEKEKNIVI